jgi:undecaprenyl-diphosphatase
MDWRLFHWVNAVQQRTTWAHGPLRLYAKVGIVVFPLAIVVAWWVARRERDPRRVAAAAWAGLAALGALVVNQLVGQLVLRPRPYLIHSGVHLLVGRTADFSFPSDHLAVAAAVAAALFLVDRRLGSAAAILAGFMALARVYVGAHYPGDVAGGIVIGVLVALAGWPLAVRVLEPLAARLARSPLRPLVFARDTQ